MGGRLLGRGARCRAISDYSWRLVIRLASFALEHKRSRRIPIARLDIDTGTFRNPFILRTLWGDIPDVGRSKHMRNPVVGRAIRLGSDRILRRSLQNLCAGQEAPTPKGCRVCSPLSAFICKLTQSRPRNVIAPLSPMRAANLP